MIPIQAASKQDCSQSVRESRQFRGEKPRIPLQKEGDPSPEPLHRECAQPSGYSVIVPLLTSYFLVVGGGPGEVNTCRYGLSLFNSSPFSQPFR